MGVGVAVAVSVGVAVAVSVGVGVAVSVGVDVGDPVTTTTAFPVAADSIASGSATTLVSRRENTSAEVRRNSVVVRPLYGMEILSFLSDAPCQGDSVAGATGNGQSGARPICHPRPAIFGLRQALCLEWYSPALLDMTPPTDAGVGKAGAGGVTPYSPNGKILSCAVRPRIRVGAEAPAGPPQPRFAGAVIERGLLTA